MRRLSRWVIPVTVLVLTIVATIFVPVQRVIEPNFPSDADCVQPIGGQFSCYSEHTHWFWIARTLVLLAGLGLAAIIWIRARQED